jgi:general stress protein 26
MKTFNFSEIAADFLAAAHTQVWCSVATVDTQNRPRSRVLHPIWENSADHTIGWVATGRTSPKAKHLEHNPYLSLCYMQNPLKPTYIDCLSEWVDDAGEKQRIWDLLRNAPEPLGYDPAPFFNAVDNPFYGVLKLTPWRIELADLFGETRVWQAVE